MADVRYVVAWSADTDKLDTLASALESDLKARAPEQDVTFQYAKLEPGRRAKNMYLFVSFD